MEKVSDVAAGEYPVGKEGLIGVTEDGKSRRRQVSTHVGNRR